MFDLSEFDIFKGTKLNRKKSLQNLKNAIAAQRVALVSAKTDFAKENLQFVLELLMEIESSISFD